MSAQRVSARIGILPLLAGRFRLHTLELEDLHVEIRRNLAGEITPPPVATLRNEQRSESPAELEDALNGMRIFEKLTRAVLTDAFIAKKVEVRNGTVRLVDAYSAGPGRGTAETALVYTVGPIKLLSPIITIKNIRGCFQRNEITVASGKAGSILPITRSELPL